MSAELDIHPETNVAAVARASIRALAEHRGLKLDAENITQVMIDNPDLNRLRLQADEWQYGYRRTADEAREYLTKAQRHSWAACGPYLDKNGKRNQAHADRSTWLCWLSRRAGNSLALTKRQRDLIAAEYHHLTLKQWEDGEAGR